MAVIGVIIAQRNGLILFSFYALPIAKAFCNYCRKRFL
jgi:hypothetical protein